MSISEHFWWLFRGEANILEEKMEHYRLRWNILVGKQKNKVQKPCPSLQVTYNWHLSNITRRLLNQWQRFQRHLDIKMAHTYVKVKHWERVLKLRHATVSVTNLAMIFKLGFIVFNVIPYSSDIAFHIFRHICLLTSGSVSSSKTNGAKWLTSVNQ